MSQTGDSPQSIRPDYHVTEPGHEASEHCPQCGAWASRLDDTATTTTRWRCQNCEHTFLNYEGAATQQTNANFRTESSTDREYTCQSCGEHVGRSYWRVFSADDGVLDGCADCQSRTDRYGTNTVLDATHRFDQLNNSESITGIDYGDPGDDGVTLPDYQGDACCRYCQTTAPAIRMPIHFLESHGDRIDANLTT
jgi:transposase-like protein